MIVAALAAVTLPRPELIACTAVLEMLCPTNSSEPLGVSDTEDDEGSTEADISRTDTSRDWGAPRVPVGWPIDPSERSG